MKVWITNSLAFSTLAGPYRVYQTDVFLNPEQPDSVYSTEEAVSWCPVKGPITWQVTVDYYGQGVEWHTSQDEALRYVEKLRAERVAFLRRQIAEIQSLPIVCGSRNHEPD